MSDEKLNDLEQLQVDNMIFDAMVAMYYREGEITMECALSYGEGVLH